MKNKISVVILTHNRLELLKRCINSININNYKDYEIIVINNASSDGTQDYLISQKNIITISNTLNEGVVARNKGFDMATGNIIFQVDDDATIFPNSLEVVNRYFINDEIGAIGQDASYWDGWLSFRRPIPINGYADFVTGYLWAFRNNLKFRYDNNLNPFWREESFLQIQIRYIGLNIIHCEPLGSHASNRITIDRDLLTKNTKYVIDKWKPLIDNLYKNDTQFFHGCSIEDYKTKYLNSNEVIIG